MKKAIVTVVLASVLIAGCASSAQPKLVRGNYYMVGDSNCVGGHLMTDNHFLCFDKEQNPTGYRLPLSTQQLQAYQLDKLTDKLRAARTHDRISATFQRQVQSMGSRQPTYTPTVQGVPQANKGVTYHRVGNTLVGSDGTSCQLMDGSTTICR